LGRDASESPRRNTGRSSQVNKSHPKLLTVSRGKGPAGSLSGQIGELLFHRAVLQHSSDSGGGHANRSAMIVVWDLVHIALGSRGMLAWMSTETGSYLERVEFATKSAERHCFVSKPNPFQHCHKAVWSDLGHCVWGTCLPLRIQSRCRNSRNFFLRSTWEENHTEIREGHQDASPIKAHFPYSLIPDAKIYLQQRPNLAPIRVSRDVHRLQTSETAPGSQA